MDYSQLPGRDEQACLLINFAEGIHEESVKKLLLISEASEAAKEMNARKVGDQGLASAWQVTE